jgi:quercetin dioxygenase-like cupin family protein
MNDHREPDRLTVADLARLVDLSTDRVPVWTHTGDDLNVNLIVLEPGTGIPPHVNTEIDVLIVGVSGDGTLEIDGTAWPIAPLHAAVIPKDATRAMAAGNDRLAYLTCHRRRAGLMPRPPRSV